MHAVEPARGRHEDVRAERGVRVVALLLLLLPAGALRAWRAIELEIAEHDHVIPLLAAELLECSLLERDEILRPGGPTVHVGDPDEGIDGRNGTGAHLL